MNSCNQPCQNPRGNSGQRESNNREMMQRERMPMPNKPCEMERREMSNRPCEMERHNMEGISLAMAYVPWQRWGNLYQPEEGFHCGTIFKDLDLPFTGRRMC